MSNNLPATDPNKDWDDWQEEDSPTPQSDLERMISQLIEWHVLMPLADRNRLLADIMKHVNPAFKKATDEARWTSPVDLNDPKNMLRFVNDPVEKFNLFIKKWCPSYSHLIDSDDNDGEEIREMIRQLQPTPQEKSE